MEAQSLTYLFIATVILFFLFTKKVMTNSTWTATMTPLASIIGSGFLISAPLLNELSGIYAPVLMAILCLASFGIGEVIRWNINDVEPVLLKSDFKNHTHDKVRFNERISDWVLAFAYILSITYYLYLFSSFFLRMTGDHSVVVEKGVVTVVIMAIAFFGHQHGLSSLERLESVSVNVKLSIIVTFLMGLAAYQFGSHQIESKDISNFNYHSLAVSLGLLIMVQGFETSRYLSEKYNRELRVRSMRYAQLISSAIYMLLIVLFIPVFKSHPLSGMISETSVIDIGQFVFVLAPTFLFAAAMASQLSAAIADMGGGGGLFAEISSGRIKSKNAYLFIACVGTILVWLFDIFKIISFASKAFALYYLFQCISSCLINYRVNKIKFTFSFLMAVLCLVIVILGQPFE